MSLIIFPNGKEILDLGRGIPKGYRVKRVVIDKGVRHTFIVESRSAKVKQFFLNLFVKAGDRAHRKDKDE